MGTWGLGTFDDDIARDWLEDLHDSDPVAFFRHCLDLTGHDDLEYLACVGVVCTAEIIQGLVANHARGFPNRCISGCRSIRKSTVVCFFPRQFPGSDG